VSGEENQHSLLVLLASAALRVSVRTFVSFGLCKLAAAYVFGPRPATAPAAVHSTTDTNVSVTSAHITDESPFGAHRVDATSLEDAPVVLADMLSAPTPATEAQVAGSIVGDVPDLQQSQLSSIQYDKAADALECGAHSMTDRCFSVAAEATSRTAVALPTGPHLKGSVLLITALVWPFAAHVAGLSPTLVPDRQHSQFPLAGAVGALKTSASVLMAAGVPAAVPTNAPTALVVIVQSFAGLAPPREVPRMTRVSPVA
tara:strand:- start:2390 stop:3163 length:774 start_codon:yes stop_codon:yes gene_type:complete